MKCDERCILISNPFYRLPLVESLYEYIDILTGESICIRIRTGSQFCIYNTEERTRYTLKGELIKGSYIFRVGHPKAMFKSLKFYDKFERVLDDDVIEDIRIKYPEHFI
jgi:hypothetical protein